MNEFSFSYLLPAMPEIFLAIAGMILLIAGVLRGNQGTVFFCWATVFTFVICAAILLGLDWSSAQTFRGLFVLDGFSGFIKLLIVLGVIASLAISTSYLKEERLMRFEYPILILFAGLGMMMMVSANNMMSLYVGLELQSLALYVLAAIRRNSTRSAEAGIKYFILGAISSGILLFGMSLIYGYTGSLQFELIAQSLSEGPSIAAIFGLVFILAAMAFKISAVPFHMWTPDVYEGAPTSVTAFFAIVPKIAGLALLIRLLFGPFGDLQDQWMQIIWFLSLASMILGAFAALSQDNIKRLMAYSSIGNIGYVLIGIVVGTQDGIAATVFYMMIYMIMTAGAFSIILCMRRDGIAVEKIEDLSGLSKNAPWLAYSMAILMWSMAGIPPLAGFFGKLAIFNAAIGQELYVLAVLGVLTSVVAAYYYLRVIKVMFFQESHIPFDPEIAFPRRAVICISVLFALAFILAPDSLLVAAQSASSALSFQ